MIIITGTVRSTPIPIKLHKITLFLAGSLAYHEVYESTKSMYGKLQMCAMGSILS